jgi:hypothetical protein
MRPGDQPGLRPDRRTSSYEPRTWPNRFGARRQETLCPRFVLVTG